MQKYCKAGEKKKLSSACKKQPKRQPIEHSRGQRHVSPPQTTIGRSISEPIYDVAVSFLLGDYIQGSQFEYLPWVYNACQATDVLSPTLKAVGLASLSLYASRPELQGMALTFYGKAINAINEALQCQTAAQRDDVLASVMLLSLYETLTSRNTTDIQAWSTHMHGALSLVALRGPEQYQSKIGLGVFKQIATSIKLFCVQYHTRIPTQLRAMLDRAASHSPVQDVTFVRPSIIQAFADLRADIAEGILFEPRDIIARSEEVLQLLEDFLIRLPPSNQYDTVIMSRPSPGTYKNYYLNFHDHYSAQIWNTAWMGKMQLNTMIYDQELRLLEETCTNILENPDQDQKKTGIDRACQEVISAAENICATVTQFFPCHKSSKKPYNVSTGYSLIWPLFTAGSSRLIEASTRDYVVSSLDCIATTFKLPQARQAVDMLIAHDCDESWMHMYHVF